MIGLRWRDSSQASNNFLVKVNVRKSLFEHKYENFNILYEFDVQLYTHQFFLCKDWDATSMFISC